MENLKRLLEKIDKAILNDEKIVIGIDGRCAAGKTTLSEHLSDKYGAQIIHTDHFFLPPLLRTPQRLSEAGGNIHYERFFEQVIKKLSKQDFEYDVFDCSVMDYNGKVTVKQASVTVVEGCYCMREEFRCVYDITVFLDIPPTRQRERITKRNGADGYKVFENRWIPMEEKYFSQCGIRDICDIVIEG